MAAEIPTRRDFLRGQVVAPRSPAPARASSAPLAAERSPLLVSVRRRAMACDFEVQLSADRDDNSMEHVFAALDLVEALEAQMTVYRDDSEVMEINRRAAAEPVPVEPRLFDLFRLAETLYHDTRGTFDITSGPLSEAWGFSRREGRIPSEEQLAAARERTGMQHVALDAARQKIAFRRPGITVNFNSIGKGYALDRMAELLATNLVGDYLLHGGKSSVVARGDQPGAGGPGWTVGLRHPLRPGERIAEFRLRNQALSTSGSGTQFFIRRGRRYGHILDPRTGRPAESLYSATVLAPTAAEADALSTAFYILGPQEVERYCETHEEVAAVLVGPSERGGEVSLYVYSLDEDQWRPHCPTDS